MNVASPIQVFRWFSHKSLGICLTTALAGTAYLLRTLPGLNLFSPLILAIVLGMLLRNTIGMSNDCQAGVSFAMKQVLRFAIVLLGLQLSLIQVMSIGINGITLTVFTLLSTFGFTCWMGQWLGISRSLTYLIAAGTSICGASAVIATSTATKSSDRDTTYAVAIVTILALCPC
ncbi:MAG: putative sulfate exporter family transporter, partial [Pseudanabaena sp. CRU_2_10]|nr:putative sulfate exporter family transporter [Pseudanabaena sp. CRU_2_10]